MWRKNVITLIGCTLTAWVSVNSGGVMMISPQRELLPKEFQALATRGPVTTPELWKLTKEQCIDYRELARPLREGEKDL